MATAHALAISEIIMELAEHVCAEPAPDTRKRDLARLARVARIFYEPAVRLLWAEMSSIEPLFRILSNCVPTPAPVNAVEDEGEATESPYTLTLHGPTIDHEIARLQEYAGRIRVLKYSSREEYSRKRGSLGDIVRRGITLDPHSLENLLLATGLPLLPSLGELTLHVTPPYLSDPTFLICPSLQKLAISFPRRRLHVLNDGIGTLFSGIFAQVPRLTHLRVQSEYFMHHDPSDTRFKPWMRLDEEWPFDLPPAAATNSNMCHNFCDALASVSMLGDLEVFSMITMDTGVSGRNLTSALSALPRLRECSLAVSVSPEMLHTIRPGFPNLCVLAISNVTFGIELKLFNSPHLQILTIYHCDWIGPDIHRLTIETATQQFPCLRRLEWQLGDRRVDPFDTEPSERILADTLRPLSTLHGLRELTINVINRHIRDDVITILVQTCPHLAHLELNFDNNSIAPSARSLQALAQGCPSLQTLHLGGILITQAEEGNVDAFPYIGNQLRLLTIVNLRCKGVIHSAMIIDMLFPFLDIRECRRRASQTDWFNLKGKFANVLDRLEAYHAERE